MDSDQEATWLALLELAEDYPDKWCLIGGQMVALHAYEHGKQPPRLTTDGDLVVNIRVDRDALAAITGVLQARGFEEDLSADGVGHRWLRGDAALDILVPEGVGERRVSKTVTGARTVAADGATQALRRAEFVTVELPNGTIGRVARPSLLGAIVAKCAAAKQDGRDRDRHLTDVVFLCSLITSARTMRSDTDKKDRQRLSYAVGKLDDPHAWRTLQDPERAQGALKLLATQPQS